MPFFKKGGALQLDISDAILEVSQKSSEKAIELARGNAPVRTGAYQAGLEMTTPDVKGWTIKGTVGHSEAVEFRWGHNTLDNSVEKALTDNGVKIH